MAVLTPQQRNTLEAAVKQARKVAELGAFNALHSMAVDHPEPFAHMTPEQRGLRNNLRSKARLLGDPLPANGAQKIDHIGYELAYETWHKMLFAKFLEANGLLMHTDGVAVTMEDCEELAPEEGFVDKWDAAANYASKMLPAIFRTNDPLMQVAYATEERIKLETIIDALENQIFIADDALGWVYQFWQSDAKAAINASGEKIDGEKLPAVTQLFTEPYMVHFLIDNTLGAWWVSRNPDIKPPVKFEYLRLLEDGTPAAGKFEGWPDKTAEVTALDPCMGSGHFVASLFPVFAALRMHEEGLTKEEATDKVITENLHGLELDARCTQIAAFNLALTAWKFCGHYKELPEMNLACSGIAPKGKVEDWVKLVGNVERPVDKARMENGMRVLYDHFQLAPELGSLLDPTTIKSDAFTASFEELQPILKRALENEVDTEQLERGVMAAGIAKAGQLLGKKYEIAITNVPYLGRKLMSDFMLDYTEKYFGESKQDLATVFIERIKNLLNTNCTIAAVSPHNWYTIKTYFNFRKLFIDNFKINFTTHLGSGAFSQITGEVVNVTLLISSKDTRQKKGIHFASIDVSKFNLLDEKKEGLLGKLTLLNQDDLKNNPDTRIILELLSSIALLSKKADSIQGLVTGDNFHLTRNFWEIFLSSENKYWCRVQSANSNHKLFDGFDRIINYQNKGNLLARNQGLTAWGKVGVSVNVTSKLFSSLYFGAPFTSDVAIIIPKKETDLLAVFDYCSSDSFYNEVRKIDKKLGVTNATLVKVPFDLEYWQKVAAEKYPNGLPKPYSDDPTQWLFHGHPIKTDNPLQVALARVLGYRWPAEEVNNTSAIVEAASSGFQKETDSTDSGDIKNNAAGSSIYDTLAEEAKELIDAVKAFDHLSDDDGIFCIPSVNAEQAGAERLRDYLQQVFAGEWNNQTITQLLRKVEAASSSLDDYLRNEFFSQHCKLFQNRPFIWHIWDGRKDGFSALVNYHKLDKDNLSKLIYTYLNDWLRVCVAKKNAGESGAEGLLSAAQKLKENLEAILHGEAPYDIFVRWKSLAEQPMGWEPDLNDGVRLNIRPFVEAGVLRNKFNVKWGVDRGKNPPGSYWGEIRDNDKHLSLEAKREAREKIKK